VAAKQRGEKPCIMCHPMVMMFEAPFHDELTNTMGPGSKKRRIPENGHAF
jgi:hypothetical protein